MFLSPWFFTLILIVTAAVAFAWLLPENISDDFADWVSNVEEQAGIGETMMSVRASFDEDEIDSVVTLATAIPNLQSPEPAQMVEPTIAQTRRPTPTELPDPTLVVSTTAPVTTPSPTSITSSQYVAGLPPVTGEYFYDQIHDTCQTPPRRSLRVAEIWEGTGSDSILIPSSYSEYFLVLEVQPTAARWGITSIYNASRKKFNSLSLSSDIKDERLDAQMWCSSGIGITSSGKWEPESFGLDWVLYLVTLTVGEVLPKQVDGALDGYYGDYCPAYPEAEDLFVKRKWQSSKTTESVNIPFTMTPPFTFLIAEFEPTSTNWEFTSLNTDGAWKAKGPEMSSESGRLRDITITCPEGVSQHQLKIESTGGDWAVYQVAVK